jgi:hypothetical protein
MAKTTKFTYGNYEFMWLTNFLVQGRDCLPYFDILIAFFLKADATKTRVLHLVICTKYMQHLTLVRQCEFSFNY